MSISTTVTGRHLDVTEPIRVHAEEQVAKLAKYSDRIQRVEVILDKSNEVEFSVEIIAHVDAHDPFIGSDSQQDLYACIDSVTHKLERQLHDHKERMKAHH